MALVLRSSVVPSDVGLPVYHFAPERSIAGVLSEKSTGAAGTLTVLSNSTGCVGAVSTATVTGWVSTGAGVTETG